MSRLKATTRKSIGERAPRMQLASRRVRKPSIVDADSDAMDDEMDEEYQPKNNRDDEDEDEDDDGEERKDRKSSKSSAYRSRPEVIDVEAIVEQPVPEAKIQQLKALLGSTVSAARCKDLLLGADLDVDRALNHHFDSQENGKPSAAAAAASSSSSSSAKKTPAKKPLSSLLTNQPSKTMSAAVLRRERAEMAAAAATSSSSSSSASPSDPFVSASSLLDRRSSLGRAAKPTSFKKKPAAKSSSSKPPKKKRRKSNSDEDDDDDEEDEDEDEDDEDSEFDASDPSNNSSPVFGASSKKLNYNFSDSDDSDSDDSGMFGGFGFGGIPFMRRGVGRGGAAAAARARVQAALALAAAAGGPARRRGRGGRGRGGVRAGRASAAAIKAENSKIVTQDMIDEQEDDNDAVRLSQVQTITGPPAPIDVARAGVRFPETYKQRASWRVGTMVDCNLMDGRGWERAKIVNIVAAPRTFALSYDISFEGRRPDVLKGAIFRFSAMDLSRIDIPDTITNTPRFTPGDDEADRVIQRAKQQNALSSAKKGGKKGKNNAAAAAPVANSDSLSYTIQDFRHRQLIDVLIGSRWFLGQVTDSKFVLLPEGGYTDVLDVQLVDFHADCGRRYVKAQLDQIHPIAYTHALTHYPLAALPTIRDKEFDIISVYASRTPGFLWSSESIGAPKDDEEEEKKDDAEPELALPGLVASSTAAAAASSSSSSSAAAAASSSSSSSLAASSSRNAALSSLLGLSISSRPLGHLELVVVSDADYTDRGPKANPRKLLERALPCTGDDPRCTQYEGQPLTREESLRRLLAIMDYGRGHYTWCKVQVEVEIVQTGQPEDDSDKQRGDKYAPTTKKQLALESKYRKFIDAEFWSQKQRSANDRHNLRMQAIKSKLNAIEKKQTEARKKAVADGVLMDEEDIDFVVSEDEEAEPVPPKKKPKSRKKKKSTKLKAKKLDSDESSASSDEDSEMEERKEEEDEDADEQNADGTYSLKAKLKDSRIIDEHGSLRWYRVRASFDIIRTGAKDPKKTSQEAGPLNELMLLLFPQSVQLKRLSREAVRPMPSYLPESLSLDGLLKHSAHYHHAIAEREAKEKEKEQEEEKKHVDGGGGGELEEKKEMDVEMKDADEAKEPDVPLLQMNSAQLSRASALIPVIKLKDYQVQTVRWMIDAEAPESNVSKSFWCELQTGDGCKFQYSPMLQRFTFSDHPNIKGGWICEEMGLGKTIECLALLNLKANEDVTSAETEMNDAIAANPNALISPPTKYCSVRAVRDANGAFITRATLIICPVSLIAQWIAELKEKSARPLKILSYHGTRPKDPKKIIDYDIVITAYSILSKESSMISTRAKAAARMTPWSYSGKAGLDYSSPLGQIHWRRIVLDEGHSIKNGSAECSQQAIKLLARCRYLMSGTPFGTSLMDLRGQTRFLGLTGFAGTHLFNALYRFMQSQARYQDLARKIAPDDYEGVPYRVHQWLKRFRNVFTHLVTHCMMRHEKSMNFLGRDTLLVLPAARIEVVRVDLTPRQRAAYKLLFEFACKRFEQFKASGDAVRKTIEVLQLLVPLRQACSVDTVNIDEVKRQLRNIARGIVVGPILGGASAASAAFPIAKSYAFGTLADECTICLDVLEDAVQTNCCHLYCKECILALCESRGADAVCPNCRAPVAPNQLFAPLIEESKEDKERREEKEQEESERQKKQMEDDIIKEEKKEQDAEMKDVHDADDEDKPILAASSAAAAASSSSSSNAKPKIPAKKATKKRKRFGSDEDDEEEERKSDGEDEDDEDEYIVAPRRRGRKIVKDEDEDDAADEGEEESKEVEEEEIKEEDLSGQILFDNKLKALISEIRAMKAADPTAKALVFTQFRNSMDKISESMKTEGIRFEMLLGHYTLSQRKKALDNFRTNPDTTVFLLSVRAAAAGLTLTSANFVYIVEPGFNPAITLQAINRVWRMGQQKIVTARYMVCTDTVEETILVIAREKLAKRGGAAANDEADHSGGSNLSLMPELKESRAGIAAAAAAAAAVEAPAAAAAAAANAPAESEAERLRGGRWGQRAARAGRNAEANREAGRGAAVGHATDETDVRLGELERLFTV